MNNTKKVSPNKVYFTASITGKKHYLDNYLKIIRFLENKNCQVIYNHIINSTESEVKLEKKEDRIRFHKQLERWITGCDFVVAETSFPSISIGYEISLALHLLKPILILYSTGDPPTLLAHHKEEKLVCEKYNKDTLSDIIDDFINYVRGTIDTRFTFFITPKIASFLEKVSKKNKLPKSVYLRKLIEKDMKNFER